MKHLRLAIPVFLPPAAKVTPEPTPDDPPAPRKKAVYQHSEEMRRSLERARRDQPPLMSLAYTKKENENAP